MIIDDDKNEIIDFIDDNDFVIMENKEVLDFENERILYLSNDDYLKNTEIKTAIFGGKTRKAFLSYLNNICSKNNITLDSCLKEYKKLDLISYIIKTKLKNIVISSNKLRNKGILKILNSPLLKEELEEQLDEEISYLNEFLLDFNTSIYLVDAFSKRKTLTSTNKNLKIKRYNNEIILQFKKYIFLDNNESEDIKKIKVLAEKKVLNFFKDKNYYSYKNREKGNTKLFITKEKIIKDFNLINYYEFFLLKNYIIDINSEVLNEYELNKNKIHNIDKKDFFVLFNSWIALPVGNRQNVISEFNSFIS